MLGTATILDRRFYALWPQRPRAQVLYTQGVFAEGPVWFADHQCLYFSDIPANRILRVTSEGHVSVFRDPSSYANGNTSDRLGRLVTCEHGTRQVTRTEPDGTLTVLADAYQGRPLNSPNDVVVKSDGTVWFTDPDYGLRLHNPGEQKHQPCDHVFRVDSSTGVVTAVAQDFDKPNGLAFSPDESALYVADSAITDGPERNSHIRRFGVRPDGTLSGGEIFAVTDGIPDGMRVDAAGNLWASAGAKIDVYAPDATLLGQIGGFAAPVTNLTFGGKGGETLFVTAGGGVFAVDVGITGAQKP